MNSRALAIVIIGVSIFVLVMSSAIDDPPDQAPHVFLISPAKAHILPKPVAAAADAAGRSRSPAGEDASHGEGSSMACASPARFSRTTVAASDQSRCTSEGQDGLSPGLRCEGKVVFDCVGDFLSNTANPSGRPNEVFHPPA